MKMRLLPVVLLTLGVSTTAIAQTKDKTERKEKESIIIRKDKDSKEKTTIIIDGDNITINGKPLSELKDADVEVIHGKGVGPIKGFRSLSSPRGGVKMFEGFPFGGNKALLGVISQKDEKGAKVSVVEKESAAEKAGLKKDDIITKVNDTKIGNSEDLYDAISEYKPEEKVTITYLRDGKEAIATATLGKRNVEERSLMIDGNDFGRNFDKREFHLMTPSIPGLEKLEGLRDMEFSYRKPRMGLKIQDIDDGKGVKILDVDDESVAEKAGLKKDDVITEIDGKAVNSVDDLKSKTKELKEGDSIKLTYQRGDKSQSATIAFPKKLKTAEL